MKEQVKEKKVMPYNVLNNRVAKVALAASLLLTGATSTVSTVGPSVGIVGELMEINHAEAASVFDGGAGTVADPYLVADKVQLNEMRNYLTSHFKLTSDIDLSGLTWTPIGTAGAPFKGTFDGGNFTIDGLQINSTVQHAGFFGYTNSLSTIKNITLKNASVTGINYVGALVGYAYGGIIDNVNVEGSVVGKSGYVGGVAGYSQATITKVSMKGTVFTENGEYLGGLVGKVDYRSVSNSYSVAKVTGGPNVKYVGGIIGASNSGTLENVYSAGDTSGSTFVGGITGHGGSITNAYAIGVVQGNSNVGGISGYSQTLQNVYAFNSKIIYPESKAVDGRTLGKVVGSVQGALKFTKVFLPETSQGVGMHQGATDLLTNSNITNPETYESLLNTGLWEIDPKSKLPVLSFHLEELEALNLSDKVNYLKDGIDIFGVISTPQEFIDVKYSLTNKFKLVNDINLNGAEWVPIGNQANPFEGLFDGNSFKIEGLYINSTNQNVGLFGYATSLSTVKNIYLENVNITGSSIVGALIGNAYGGIVENVRVEGSVTASAGTVGGIIGQSMATISNVSMKGSVNSNSGDYVGGIVGRQDSKKVSNAYSNANILGGKGRYVGGIAGSTNGSGAKLEDIYTTGKVSGVSYVGGIAGHAGGQISKGYSTSLVEGVDNIGGIAGYSFRATNVYALNSGVFGSTTKLATIGKVIGSGNYTDAFALDTMETNAGNSLFNTSITEEKLKKKETYSIMGFDFGDFTGTPTWMIDEGETTPYLAFNPAPIPFDPDAPSLEELIDQATEGVEKAETNKTQADVDVARDLVNQLPEGLDKTNLTNRLDSLQEEMNADKALQDAKDAVDNLGDNPTQEELDLAKEKVEVLPESSEKDDLLKQIKGKQDALDKKNTDKALVEQIAKATEAILKAEASKTLADIDAARDLVDKLPDGEVKTDLNTRLDAIQKATDEDKALEEVKDALDNLGDNPTQEGLDAIKDMIDELSDGPGKEMLLDQMKEKQDALDKEKAEKVLADQIDAALKAVEQAETSKTQADVAIARNLVNKLPDGVVKTDLTERLDVIQQILDGEKDLEIARSLVDQLGDNPTQQVIDMARNTVQNLPDGKDKTELLAKVKAKQEALDTKVTDARQSVEAIGTPPSLEELTKAQEKVNLLPAGGIKTNLQKQINDKQKQLNEGSEQLAKAESAVSKAESFPTNYNVTIATKLVEALPNSETKTALEDRLQAIQDMFALEKAEAKVKQAENYERDPYLAEAIALVDALTDNNGKQGLKGRIQVILDKLQAVRDAEDAANNADGVYDPADPKQTIEDAINTIQDTEAKKYFANWNKAVGNAEDYFSKTTVKNATKYLTELPSAYTSVASYGNIIKELTERTENLKAEEVSVDLFAPVEKAVANYEKYQSSYYLKKAKEAVEALTASPEKTAFEIRLGIGDTSGNEPIIEEKLAAQLAIVEKAVATYEKFKTNFYQKKATEAVALMVDSEVKKAFQARLDAVIK